MPASLRPRPDLKCASPFAALPIWRYHLSSSHAPIGYFHPPRLLLGVLRNPAFFRAVFSRAGRTSRRPSSGLRVSQRLLAEPSPHAVSHRSRPTLLEHFGKHL